MAQQQLSSAPQKRIVHTHDIDEQAQSLTHWQQKYDQLSEGRFFGCMQGSEYANLHVFEEYTERALRQQCEITPDAIWLGIPKKPQQSKINGLTVDYNQFMCRNFASDFELITPEQFNIYGLVINFQTLKHIAALQGEQLNVFNTQGAERISIAENTLNSARAILNSIINNQGFGLNSHLQHDMLTTLALHLLKDDSPQHTIVPSYSHRKKVVDEVKSYIQANPQSTVTITQLCELTHVSRRTLQYSFESILGINPLRFLRLTRLNNVRRELKRLHQDKPIAVVAANWGFWHAGQFSKDYTQLFGENPSQTLNSSR